MRGINDPRPFAELLIADLPNDATLGYHALQERLLSTAIEPLMGQSRSTFADAVDLCGAMFEESPDYVNRLRRQYQTSQQAGLIIVPDLLATRPLEDPRRALNSELNHLAGAAVTSLHFGGCADVAALIARRASWGYASATKVTRATFSTGQRPYGGQENPNALIGRAYHRGCQEVSEQLLNPDLIGRSRVSTLDEPINALAAIRSLTAHSVANEPGNFPVIMLRISRRRIQWAADRRAIARPGGGTAGDDGAKADQDRLVSLQDELSQAVEAITDRPSKVFELEESKADYTNLEKDTTDEDFDTYVEASERLWVWLRSLSGEQQ
jgi:hypothetical protein